MLWRRPRILVIALGIPVITYIGLTLVDNYVSNFVVKPNELEAEVLTGIPVTDQPSAEQAARWFIDRGVSVAMITRGAHGVILVGPDGVAEYPAFPATPVDTTAAGDAFCGALGASLASGAALPEALRRGLAAGALAVAVRGASPSLPTAEAVDAFLASQR